MRTLVIYGAGGHGKVVLDAALAGGWNGPILLVDAAPAVPEIRGVTVQSLDRVEWAALRPFDFVCGIGTNSARRAVFQQCLDHGGEPVSIRHPSTVVSEDTKVDVGCFLAAGAIVNPGAVIGSNCIINTSASVDHDCRIGKHVHICPGVRLAGNVTVGDGTMIGIGSSVIQGVRIGARCVIGAGSVVVRDVPDDCVAFGVPARVRREAG